jgi:hypothetical protein
MVEAIVMPMGACKRFFFHEWVRRMFFNNNTRGNGYSLFLG